MVDSVGEVPPGAVLVTGANGFIAGFIIAALREAGWRVIRAVHTPRHDADDERACDLMTLETAADAASVVAGIDAVVNVAGILRETAGRSFDSIHYRGPLALANACVERGVRQFLQISALGTAEDGAFIESKHRFDDALLDLGLDAVVLRPSVVYSTRGSYGGTSALRAQAAWPGVMLVAGHGGYAVQPLAAEDLGELVVIALRGRLRGCFEVAGPEVVTLRDYLVAWRAWLRLPPARLIHVPEKLVTVAARLADRVRRGPMGMTTWGMLINGNVAADDATTRLQEHFGTAPRRLAQVLGASPSQVQDRWHARLHALAPILSGGLVLLMLISAWAGFATPRADIEALAQGSLLASMYPVELARGAAAIDAVLGLALLFAGTRKLIMAAILALVGGYTLAFGILLPGLWLDPLGGLAKNLVVLPAIMVLWILGDRR